MDLSLRVEEEAAPASVVSTVPVATVTQATTASSTVVTTTVTTATIHVPPPEPVVSEVSVIKVFIIVYAVCEMYTKYTLLLYRMYKKIDDMK